mmetsp:Transcript_29629/g.74540  ORF Transcript_29629/g.74540 Transcript_29629/m.74540 type:complete len:121 (-) Transcript_29629:247-609(-)
MSTSRYSPLRAAASSRRSPTPGDTLAAVRLYHADKLSTSLKPPVTVRKHTSSKRTLSYQASQAARKVSRALRECDACHTLEVPGQPLQRCAGCKAVEYCSSQCQKPSLDWKAGHWNWPST